MFDQTSGDANFKQILVQKLDLFYGLKFVDFGYQLMLTLFVQLMGRLCPYAHLATALSMLTVPRNGICGILAKIQRLPSQSIVAYGTSHRSYESGLDSS